MYQRKINIGFGSPLTPVVKKIIIINVVIYLFQFILGTEFIKDFFALSHKGFAEKLYIWQIFTYMFLHGSFLHILFNMLMVWMVGSELEKYWGSRYFLRYYLLSGLGGGVFISLMNVYMTNQVSTYAVVPTIGASGAVFGLMAAYALVWPNREVLLYFLFPVKVKYFMLAMGLIGFFGVLSQVSGRGGGISHIGHLGGLVTGLLLFWYKASQPKNSSYSSYAGTGKQNGPGFLSKIVKKRKLKQKQHEIEARIKAKKIIDRLLDKIAAQGISSLTTKEKRDLEWARKNYYPGNDVTFH